MAITPSSQDYVQLGPISWDQAQPKLDFALKRIFTRLNQAEGRQGSPTIYSKLSMDGNQILNGPVPQTSPSSGEFITKAYADNTYGAEAIKPQLEATGQFPLVITNLSGSFTATTVILNRLVKFDSLQSVTSGSVSDYRTDGGESARFLADGSFYLGLTSSDRAGGPYLISNMPHVVATSAANAEYIETGCIVGQYGYIATAATGSGTARPLVFGTNGIERVRIATAGQLMVGAQSSDIGSLGSSTILTLADANGFICATGANNASYGAFGVNSGATVVIQSAHSGTGTTLPLNFQINSTEVARFNLTNQFLVGGTSTDLSIGSTPTVVTFGNTAGFDAATAATNASFIGMAIITGSDGRLESGKSGAGTYLPMTFRTSGAEQARLDTSGNLLLHGTSTTISITAGSVVTINDTAGFYSTNATSNSSWIGMAINVAGSIATIESGKVGGGTYRPMTFKTNGAETARFTTAGQFLVGGASSDIGSLGASTILTLSSGNGFLCATATTNASYGSLGVNAGASVALNSAHSGSGTTLPIVFEIDSTEVFRISGTTLTMAASTTMDLAAHSSVFKPRYVAMAAFGCGNLPSPLVSGELMVVKNTSDSTHWFVYKDPDGNVGSAQIFMC